MRLRYRLSQFWRTLSIEKDPHNLEQALALLSPEQRALFSQMQPGEQNHAVTVFKRLLERALHE